MTLSKFGPFWGNGFKYTSQHLMFLIFIFRPLKVLIKIIVEFPICRSYVGVNKKSKKSWVLQARLTTLLKFGPFWGNGFQDTSQHLMFLIFLMWTL